MKKQLICIILAISFLLPACKSPAGQSGASSDCKSFLKTVREDWTYDPDKKIYAIQAKDGRKNIELARNLTTLKKDCWKGLSARRVKKIFGEPSRIRGNAWEYFIEESCWDTDTKNCQDFYMVFQADGGLQSIDLRSFSIVE